MHNLLHWLFLQKKNHYKSFFFILFFLIIAFNGCEKQGSPLNTDAKLLNFSFLAVNNPSLSSDIHLEINDTEATGDILYIADIDSLIPTFEFLGVQVIVDNVDQQSGLTPNDFLQIVNYEVVSESGNSTIYTINTTYFTGLPIMYINTENGADITSKDEYVEGNIDFLGAKNAESFSSNDMKIRGRGNSSWALFPKKSYQIKFDDKMEIMGMPKDKRWILLANYSDKTMLRNKISLDLGQISSLDWTPQSEFVELFLNGHYHGTYLLTQKVEETSNRVDITNDGFLLEVDQLDRLNEEDVYFQSDLLLFNIQAPDVEWEDSEYSYIKEYINEIEDVLYSENFNDPIDGYTKYIDVDSFVDWYLINEITKNNDAVFAASVFMNHIPGEKLKMGPIWDFDIALGNIYYNNNDVPEGFWIKKSKWIIRLFEDPDFVAKVKERFHYFNTNRNFLFDGIDENAKYLNFAQAENDSTWQTLGIYVWPNNEVFDTYDEEVEYLKQWIEQRFDWLEVAIEEL